tara:strand:- start:2366 stop:2980 length:615 start_codon:yes stop_codon:yes gene_type:complete
VNKAKLIIFSAPSGAGKSSLIRKLIQLSDQSIELSVSATTRASRDGEVHGKDYFFMSDDEFNQMKDNDAFLESANVHGFQYATIKSYVQEKINSGISVILDIDVQGFTQIKNSLMEHISIFILPPSFEELEKRLFTRGQDSNEVILKRLKNAVTELKYADMFDYVVLNDEFNKTIETLSSILFEENFKYNDKNIENILRELLDK